MGFFGCCPVRSFAVDQVSFYGCGGRDDSLFRIIDDLRVHVIVCSLHGQAKTTVLRPSNSQKVIPVPDVGVIPHLRFSIHRWWTDTADSSGISLRQYQAGGAESSS